MDLRDYLRGIRRHLLAIVIMTGLGVGVAYGWTLLQTPVYEASASGLIQANDANPETTSLSGDAMARQKVQTYLEMASWTTVAQGAIDELGLDITPNEAAGRVTITNPTDTTTLRVTAEGESAEEALALAEAWLTSLGREVEEVDGDLLRIHVATAAALPSEPVYPDVTASLIVGGVLGLGFGIAFALMRTASDRRIRHAEDVEARSGIPVVGALPAADALGDGKRLMTRAQAEQGIGFAVSEALRALRTNLQFMDVDNPPRKIVVTSPLPGDGKSTIASNLALTLAASGKPVVLVDGDLRRSTVATTLGLPGGAGLSDVLSGRAELADVLQRTPHSPSLFVLTAGSTPPNPSEVLGSERMHRLLDDLAVHATVIVDAPPLLPVTDGAVLTHQADGALIVISAGKTTYDLLDKALDTLRKSSGRALGLVLNRVPTKGVDAGSYSSYEYDYRAPQEPEPEAAPAKVAAASGVQKLDALFAPETDDQDEPRGRLRRA